MCFVAPLSMTSLDFHDKEMMDEAWFTDGMVYRRHGEHFIDACILQKNRRRDGSVTFWGGVSYTGRKNLVVINDNLTGLHYCSTRATLLNYHWAWNDLQQDNARPHVAHVILKHFEQQQIKIDVLP